MRNFIWRVQRIDWRDDSTQSRHRVKGDGILRTIRAENAEHFTLFETTLLKVVGRDADRFGKLFVTELAASWTFDQRGLVGELFRAAQGEWRKCSFRDFYIWVGAFNNHLVYR